MVPYCSSRAIGNLWGEQEFHRGIFAGENPLFCGRKTLFKRKLRGLLGGFGINGVLFVPS